MSIKSRLQEILMAEAQEEMQAELSDPARKYRQLGRAGGLKGGPERARRLSPERRREIARLGGIARHKRPEE